MQKMKFSIEIHAPKEKVWSTLWEDTSFRDWASIIDEGTYQEETFKDRLPKALERIKTLAE